MFIANLVASVLALAMVGASTASLNKVEKNSVGSEVVLNRDVHKAYYNPDETYGTTGSYFYNYSSKNVSTIRLGESQQSGLFLNGSTSNTIYFNDYTTNYSPSETQKQEVWGQIRSDLDFYVNGVLTNVENVGQWVISPQAETVYGWQASSSTLGNEVLDDSDYIWIFDHQEATPYTPVDLLGDIAEGMTGGIVPVAEGVGEGLQSLVQDIFLNDANDGLSVFGIVIVSFCGLALALGLSRWVLNFVDSLGARDR